METSKKEKPINVAIIGLGYWGPNLLRNFFELEDSEVKWCCDLREERLARVKKMYPSVRTVTDLDKVLSDPETDAVVIATPISTHYSIAKKALEHRKHVWIEKPMVPTAKEGQELIDLAKDKEKIIFVDHVFLYTEAVRYIKGLIDLDEIGQIYYFDSTRINLGLFQPDSNVIWDLAPHDISIMCYLLGEVPESVSVFANAHAVINLEDTAYLSFKFRGGKTAHIRVSWLSPVKIRQSFIVGEKKMVVYDDLESSEKVKVYDYGLLVNKLPNAEFATSDYQYRTGDIIVPALKHKEALQNACLSFVEAIRLGKPPITDGENGLEVVKILEAAIKSIQNKGETILIK